MVLQCVPRGRVQLHKAIRWPCVGWMRARFRITAGTEPRILFVLSLLHILYPNIERRTQYYGTRRLYATTRYIYIHIYLSECNWWWRCGSRRKGYSGSSKGHYYRSVGATIEESRVMRYGCVCSCWMFFTETTGYLFDNLWVANCKDAQGHKYCSVIRSPGNGRMSHSEQKEPYSRMLWGLECWRGHNCLVAEWRERSQPRKRIFLAKIKEKAIKLEETGTYSALWSKGSYWFVFVQWYDFVSTMKNRRRDKCYKIEFPQLIPCGPIISSMKETVVMSIPFSASGGCTSGQWLV